MDRDDTHHLNCRIITSTVFSQGLILFSSQIFSQKERRIAFVFDSLPHSVWIYYFWEIGFGYYGRKDYGADAGHELSAVAISRGMLFTVLEYGKRVEIFSLSSLEDNGAVPPNPNPIMVLNSIIMGFFGVTYFAPVGIKVSALHD